MIYCVEDEKNIRELVLYALSASGFEAVGLEDGKQLEQQLALQLPDLILLDIMLLERTAGDLKEAEEQSSHKEHSRDYGNGKEQRV